MAAAEDTGLFLLSQLTLNEELTDDQNYIERWTSKAESSGSRPMENNVTKAGVVEDEKREVDENDLEKEIEYMETGDNINSGESDSINIDYNSGIVIIDLRDGFEQRHADLLERERKISRFKVSTQPLSAITPSVTKRKKIKKVKDRRKLRQTLIPYQTRKSKVNTRKPSYRQNREINITVNNNKGNVVIGDGGACHVITGYLSRNDRDGHGEMVVADGTGIITGYPSSKDRNGDGEMAVADGAVMTPSPQKPLVVCVDKVVVKKFNRFYNIINEIYPLRDNGRWEEFYNAVDQRIMFARDNGRLDEEIFLTIEKSTALSYQKKNDQSMQIVTQANSMIKENGYGLKMKEFLTVLSHCQLAALYRRENKIFKANQAVFIAEQNAVSVPYSLLAKAYVIYEKASNHAMLAGIVSASEPSAREESEKDAKEDLKSCISVCEKMLSGVDSIYLRRHHFCFLKLALTNLNCRSANARSQSVSEDSIREAQDCIIRMQHYSARGQMSKVTSILLLIAQCDHKYRTGDYSNAIVYGSQALKMAQKWGFRLEVQELEERLKLLHEHQQLKLANLFEIVESESHQIN